MPKYYVYRHIRLDKNVPFYVGKGSNNRAHSKARNEVWNRITTKASYKVEIIKYFKKESDAFNFEIQLIKAYKQLGYCKANLSNGGEGYLGHQCTENTRAKMRLAKLGKSRKAFTQQHKDALRASNKAKRTKNWKGYIVSPHGLFESCRDAALKLNVTPATISIRCRNPKWKGWYYSSSI